MSKCSRCGAPVEFIRLSETGQRVAVNPGWVPVAIGQDSGGVSMGRVVHWASCPADEPERKRIVR